MGVVGNSPLPTPATRNWILWVRKLIALGVLGAGVVDVSANDIADGFHRSGRRITYRSYNTTEEQVDYYWSLVEHRSPAKNERLPNILFVKPHKVGSSSMSNMIRLIAARNGGIRREFMYTQDIEYFYAIKELQPLEEGLHIWADHQVLRDLLDIGELEYIEESFKITLVREPLDRCLSGFYYYIKKKGIRIETLTNEEVLELKLNTVSCTRAGVDHIGEMSEVGPHGTSSSVEETLAFYNLVGVTGRYMETLTVMKMLLGLRYGDMLFFNDKYHPSARPPVAEEPPEVIGHMMSLIIPVDWDLYHAADQRLSDMIEMLEPDFTGVHNKLVESLTSARLECETTSATRGYQLPDGFGCFSQGRCQLSCLNKFASDNDLWLDAEPVDITSKKP